MEISIKESCIKCGRCVKICPAHLFTIEAGVVQIPTTDGCIVCGHCVGVCENGSVCHSEFPVNKIHSIDYDSMPSAEQVLSLICSRRSNRAFSKQAVPTAYLDLILQAAHRAPTGSNAQNLKYTVVTNPEKIRQVAKITVDTFWDVACKLRNPFLKPLLKLVMPSVYKMLPMFDRLKADFDSGGDPILRGATTLIFIHNPASSRLGVQDCNLAYQNGSIMAQSLGVSQVYLGFVLMGIKQDKSKRRIAAALGIDGEINAAMGIGMPQFQFANYIDRRPIEVSKI